jgi:hypothetical protein
MFRFAWYCGRAGGYGHHYMRLVTVVVMLLEMKVVAFKYSRQSFRRHDVLRWVHAWFHVSGCFRSQGVQEILLAIHG